MATTAFHRLADLTPVDLLAVVQAVQKQVFRSPECEGRAGTEAGGGNGGRGQGDQAGRCEGGDGCAPAYGRVDWKKAKSPRPKTAHEFETACEEFLRVVGDLPLADLTKHSLVKFKKHLLEATKAGGKLISQSTRVKRFGAVKAVIAVAVENLDIETHPGDGVIMGRAPKSRLRTDGLMDNKTEALFEGPVCT